MPPRKVNLFDESSPFIKKFMYISLGLLAGLLLIGTLGNILFRQRGRARQPNILGEYLTYIVTYDSDHWKMPFFLPLPTCAADSQVFKKHLFQSYSLDAAAVSEGTMPDTIQDDIEVARRLLRQTQEQFDRLEFKVSRLKCH